MIRRKRGVMKPEPSRRSRGAALRAFSFLGCMLAAGACSAQLPRVFLDAAYSPPHGFTGQLISVPADGNLQGALDGAQPGDTVAAGTAWIRIRSSSPGSSSSDRRVYAPVAPSPAHPRGA